MHKRALVFAGGSFSETLLQRVTGLDEMDVWCADSGTVHAASVALVPKVIVGDCDSVPDDTLKWAIEAGAELKQHPKNKNSSDLELTLRELAANNYSEVILLAASGGRTDHALFNWMLALQQDWPFSLTVIDETITAYLVHATIAFQASLLVGTTVSLLSRDSVSGVNTAGLQYPLKDARLMGGSTLGLSNLVDGARPDSPTQVRVSVESGRLLVCVIENE